METSLLDVEWRDEELIMSPRIVGKGNHSAGHIQKIKPRVEQVCREQGLQYATEDNAGRIYVNLTGGAAVVPSYPSHQAPQNTPNQYPSQQPQTHHRPQPQPQPQGEPEKPQLLQLLEKACCVVM